MYFFLEKCRNSISVCLWFCWPSHSPLKSTPILSSLEEKEDSASEEVLEEVSEALGGRLDLWEDLWELLESSVDRYAINNNVNWKFLIGENKLNWNKKDKVHFKMYRLKKIDNVFSQNVLKIDGGNNCWLISSKLFTIIIFMVDHEEYQKYYMVIDYLKSIM